MRILSYIIEVIVCSGLFLVAYRWLLAKNVSFGLCRSFIMTSMLLAVAIPTMNVPVFPDKTFTQQTVLTGSDLLENEPDSRIDSAVKTQAANNDITETVYAPEAFDIKAAAGIGAIATYILVALASLGLTIYNAVKIGRLRRRSRLTYTEEYTLAEHDDVKTPFSFLLTIFMGFNYEPDERKQILTHEASHVRHRHSFERLVLSVLRSIFWFNPFFWMAEKNLEDVQEWEADKDVLSEGYELNTYRRTIFKQLFGYNPDISCGLNHSLTKQRFIMMTQSRRGKGAWIRLAATLPVIAAAFFAFGCGVKSEAKADEAAENLTLDKQEPLTFRIHVAKSKDEKGTYSIYCNDELTDIETISKTVSEYFAGEEMLKTTVSISADENVPMGIITDIKEQLRNARALKVRYETDDNAIEKRLPPAVRNTAENSEEPRFLTPEEFAKDVSRRNHIFFKINSNDKVLLGTDRSVRDASEKPYIVNIEDFDIDVLKKMISNPENKVTYPEYEIQEFTMPDGSSRQLRMNKGMVTLQTDRGTSYEGYTKAMECISTAYKELREELSSELFGKSLTELTDAEMQIIYRAIPMNVSEAEPKDVPARK